MDEQDLTQKAHKTGNVSQNCYKGAEVPVTNAVVQCLLGGSSFDLPAAEKASAFLFPLFESQNFPPPA